MTQNAVTQEAERLDSLLTDLLQSYVRWGSQIRLSTEVHFALYDEYWEYVNLRLESVAACRLLLANGFLPDAFGRMRSLLEGYLLLRLLARGRKAFRTQDLSGKPRSEFTKQLQAVRAKWREEQASGRETWLDIRENPRRKGRIQYIYEGLKVGGEEDLTIAIQWAAYQQFRPQTARLNPDTYFKYFELDDTWKQNRARQQKESGRLYDDFLSYKALLDSLELNGLIDEGGRARVQAHYTFLGSFVHVTHNAERNLVDQSNVHHGGTGIGLTQPYQQVAMLLARTYLLFLAAGLVQEVTWILDGAPSRYVTDPRTQQLHKLVNEIERSIRYFWFIYNDASDYDKYMWAIHHASDEQLEYAGGFRGLPSALITFEPSILQRFQQALGRWRNNRCGVYIPPIPGL